MRKFLINVNGTKYEVEVEEIDGKAAQSAAPVSKQEEPKAAPAPKAAGAGGVKA